MDIAGKTVSAVIPVFNEEKTVARIIEAFLGSDLVSEVVVVNDGSKDRSLAVLEGFGTRIKLINLKRNHGKGFALAVGTKAARGEIVVFLDSDLVNFSPDHVRSLLDPILNQGVEVVLGVHAPKGRYPWNDLYLTGQRVYWRHLILPHLKRMAKARSGVEIYLNGLHRKKKIRIVPLVGVIALAKEAKWSASLALKQYLVMGIDIGLELGRKEVISAEDYQKIKRLAAKPVLKDFELGVRELKSQRLKQILKRYVLRYLEKSHLINRL
ncbi:MAG: glycosyltransferase family 2 protein [bacterium]|nr:glycosyltransferase family 2 protein [bacterium]